MIWDWNHGPRFKWRPGEVLRAAVDVAVSPRALVRFPHLHEVVRAGHAESDESWFARARAAAAHVVISPDSDLFPLCWYGGIPLIHLVHGGGIPEQIEMIEWHLTEWAMVPPKPLPAEAVASVVSALARPRTVRMTSGRRR